MAVKATEDKRAWALPRRVALRELEHFDPQGLITRLEEFQEMLRKNNDYQWFRKDQRPVLQVGVDHAGVNDDDPLYLIQVEFEPIVPLFLGLDGLEIEGYRMLPSAIVNNLVKHCFNEYTLPIEGAFDTYNKAVLPILDQLQELNEQLLERGAHGY